MTNSLNLYYSDLVFRHWNILLYKDFFLTLISSNGNVRLMVQKDNFIVDM